MSDLRQSLAATVSGFPRPFWVLFAGTIINRMGTFVVPFMALYLTQERGCSMMQAGMVAALYGAGGMIAGPVGGYLADRVGRRATMMLALSAGGLGMIALGWARTIHVIAPSMFAIALVTEMYRPGMQAAVADLVGREDRVRAFGVIYWGINLGFSIGLTLAGFLAQWSYQLLFVGDGLSSLLFAFLVWRGVPETRPRVEDSLAVAERPGGDFFVAFRDRSYLMFLGLSVMIMTVFLQHISTFPLDATAHGLSKGAFGAVVALNGVVIVLVQPFLTPLLVRFPRAHVLAAGSALVGIGFGVNAIASSVPLYALGVILWTIGEIGLLPVANSVVADLAPPQVRGRYQGAYGLSWGTASFLAPTLGSLVLQRFGGVTLWVGCLLLGLLVGALHLALGPRIARVIAERTGSAGGGAVPANA